MSPVSLLGSEEVLGSQEQEQEVVVEGAGEGVLLISAGAVEGKEYQG